VRIIKRKHIAIVDIGFRRLIYPLDTTFIRELDSRFVKKWIDAGWDVENSVMLEIRYLTIPAGQSPQAPASRIFSGVTYLWDLEKYFRTVIFSKGYFENVDEINMKIDTWHEKQHILNRENFLHKGINSPSEDQIVQREIKFVYENFGEKGVLARRKHVIESYEQLKNADAIRGDIVLPWITLYLKNNYQKYSNLAYSIPVNEYSKMIRENLTKMTYYVIQQYQVILNINITELFEQL